MKLSARAVGCAAAVLVSASLACERDDAPHLGDPGVREPSTESRPGDARGVQGEVDSELAESPDPELALRVTGARLRDCDASGPFYFFFEPGSASMRERELEHASQLNQCLARAEAAGQVIVSGYGDMGSDDQSSSSLPLSRAHNIAQRVAMGIAPKRIIVQAHRVEAVPEDQGAWHRRVEVQIGP